MSFTPRILLVEDDPQDAFLVQRHLSDLPYGGELKDIPVIVFSGDRSQHPELDTFSNVACLIQKPSSASGYEALAQALRPIVSSALARSVYAAQ